MEVLIVESYARDELASELSKLTELTSDAVAVCEGDGTICHVNGRLLDLAGESRERIVGTDIKDLLYSDMFERAAGHRVPFPLDGTDCTLMLKLADGSFVPVLVRAAELASMARLRSRLLKRGAPRGRILVTLRSLQERYAYDRQMRRVLSELQAANRRLSGTLSVIMSTVGADDLPTLLATVLDKLTDALDADGTAIYFSENGGFKLRAISHGLEHDYVPEFVPYGVGIPTYVLRQGRSCRLTVIRADEAAGARSGSFYDIDARQSRTLRTHFMPPYKTLIAVPVFFGTQVLGVIELGWKRPTTPRAYDVNVIEVVCEYLSIELMSLVASTRSRRTSELQRSLSRVRDIMFETEPGGAWGEATRELAQVLDCHVCPLVPVRGGAASAEGILAVDFEGGSQVTLPGTVEQLFFSTTAPAARVAASARDYFAAAAPQPGSGPELEQVRLTRIDRFSRMGEWLDSHGLPCQGVLADLGEDAAAVPAPAGAVALPAGDAQEPGEPSSELPARYFLLLRDGSQEPIDDIEFDYLVRLAHEYELRLHDARRHTEDRRIAQTLQVGMRSSLGEVPGIIADSLYSSATRQALVGGDFYTLLRMPDDCAVMILGDVSGKGIEAASMSALVKTALSAYAWEGAAPVVMVRSLNSMLMGFSRVETFATMFVAHLDLRRGEAVYCSAGHPPSMVVRSRPTADTPEHAGEVELLSIQSGVVGAFESMAFESGAFTFEPGDILFMYTDGAIEARDPEGEFFGEQRLRTILLEHAGMPVKGLCQRVLDELDSFTGSALEDDIALVALQFEDLHTVYAPPAAVIEQLQDAEPQQAAATV